MATAKQTTESPEDSSPGTKIQHKYFDDQFDDEEVLLVFRKHPIVMRKGLIISMLAWLVGPLYTLAWTYVKPTAPPSLAFFWLSLVGSIALGSLLLAPSWISWYFSIFILTDQRFIQITQKGLFHRAVADINLHQIQSVNYDISGLQETLLGFGTIKMQAYIGDFVIHDIHHPAKIQKKIVNLLRDQGVTANPYPRHEETIQETQS